MIPMEPYRIRKSVTWSFCSPLNSTYKPILTQNIIHLLLVKVQIGQTRAQNEYMTIGRKSLALTLGNVKVLSLLLEPIQTVLVEVKWLVVVHLILVVQALPLGAALWSLLFQSRLPVHSLSIHYISPQLIQSC
jgi:hypothetical protein